MDELPRGSLRLARLAQGTFAVVWHTAPDGRIVEHNPSWEAFTGQALDDHRDWGWLDAIHPDDRQRVDASWLAATAAGQAFSAEYRLLRHDGEYRHVRAQGTPVRAGGAVTEWVGVCMDIGDSIEAQLALERSEMRFRLLDALGQATRELTLPTDIMAATARLLGEYLGATRCAYADVEQDSDTFTIRADWTMPGVPSSAGVYSLDLFGSKARSKLRRGLHLVVHDVDAELGPDDGAAMFNAIGIKAIICAGLVKHGRLVAMMAVHQATPRHWTDQEIALVGEVVDRCWAHIERVRDQEMLREQDRRKDAFLATLAHELRNPLAPVKYALALMERSPDPERQAAARRTIGRQVTQMARLIDDLLDLSRINRGIVRLQMEPVRLADVVAQAVEAMRPQILQQRHVLQVAEPPADLLVQGDPARLVQVLENLLGNAAKYTRPGGLLQVACEAAGDEVRLEVRDNGLGIPRHEQHRLFEMFTQLEHTAAHSGGGLGIGLALVRQLVTLHGGSIAVESEGLDQGSTFTVTLPRLAAAPAAATETAAAPAASADMQSLQVLVVEDNPDGRATLVELLRLLGHEVRGAADGEQALEMARAATPQVVLLDLGLPGKSGIEVCRELRADARFGATRIMALTGWGAASDRARTQEAGFDGHLTKPVEVQALQEALRPRGDVRA